MRRDARESDRPTTRSQCTERAKKKKKKSSSSSSTHKEEEEEEEELRCVCVY